MSMSQHSRYSDESGNIRYPSSKDDGDKGNLIWTIIHTVGVVLCAFWLVPIRGWFIGIVLSLLWEYVLLYYLVMWLIEII